MPKIHAFIEYCFVETPGPNDHVWDGDPDEINEMLTLQAQRIEQLEGPGKFYDHAIS